MVICPLPELTPRRLDRLCLALMNDYATPLTFRLVQRFGSRLCYSRPLPSDVAVADAPSTRCPGRSLSSLPHHMILTCSLITLTPRTRVSLYSVVATPGFPGRPLLVTLLADPRPLLSPSWPSLILRSLREAGGAYEFLEEID